ncbi:MAG: hypothetical protein ACM31E_01550 [Fibrobacterota bacterium]
MSPLNIVSPFPNHKNRYIFLLEITNMPGVKIMIELLQTRISMRKYTLQEIDKSTIDLLNETLLRSTSSRGFNV